MTPGSSRRAAGGGSGSAPKATWAPLTAPTQPNERWSTDFVRDALGNGRAFPALTIVGDDTREHIAIEVDTSLPGERFVAVLERLAGTRGLPAGVVCDNGPEFAGQVTNPWAH